jgi:hypothetical protein
MKIPYGLSNFKDVVTEKYLYVDKTAYIATLEQEGKFNILLRPRRFGKSLFLSTLWHYYDIRYKDEFETLFSGLAVNDNPTPLCSSYQVLFMEFSGISDVDNQAVERDFLFEVHRRLRIFLRRYRYPSEAIRHIEATATAASAMKAFFEVTEHNKIYLLIDEYDHFANSILGTSLERFQRIIGRGGFVRSFYETIKTATMEGIVDRFFITGVTSITLDSLTSGFNIGNNITHNKAFNQAIGFTRQEVEKAVQPLVAACDLEQQRLIQELSCWYNGYCFSTRAEERLFNADMVLYFIKKFDTETCLYPEQMLDDNIASDYRKIMQLFSIGDRSENFKVLEELITTGEVVGLHSRKLDVEKKFDQSDFLGLLLYMGFITITGSLLNRIRYGIPNYVIQKLYYDYFRAEAEQRAQLTLSSRSIEDAVIELALHNNIAPLTEEIHKALAMFSNRDFMKMDEKHIKAVILTLLYQSEIYFIRSEPEVNNRYPDIMLLERNPFKVEYQFLFELKYSKKKDGDQGWKEKKKEGVRQIRECLCLQDVQDLSKLQSYLLLTNGSEVEAIPVLAADR